MSLTITNKTVFVVEDCCVCGMQFAMTEDFRRRKLNNHEGFYCPSGHGQSYTGKTEAQKQRERADKLEQQADAARARAKYWREENERTTRSRSAVKGQLTKTKKRIAGGACPCCNRSFVDLAKHMAGQHPEFVDDHTSADREIDQTDGASR